MPCASLRSGAAGPEAGAEEVGGAEGGDAAGPVEEDEEGGAGGCGECARRGGEGEAECAGPSQQSTGAADREYI